MPVLLRLGPYECRALGRALDRRRAATTELHAGHEAIRRSLDHTKLVVRLVEVHDAPRAPYECAERRRRTPRPTHIFMRVVDSDWPTEQRACRLDGARYE